MCKKGCSCKKCCVKVVTKTGPIGPTGKTGKTGPQGPIGPAGPAGAGAEITAQIETYDPIDGEDISGAGYDVVIPITVAGNYMFMGYLFVVAAGSQEITLTNYKNAVAVGIGAAAGMNAVHKMTDTANIPVGNGTYLGLVPGDNLKINVASSGAGKLFASVLQLIKLP
jgi:hypothetical protein